MKCRDKALHKLMMNKFILKVKQRLMNLSAKLLLKGKSKKMNIMLRNL